MVTVDGNREGISCAVIILIIYGENLVKNIKITSMEPGQIQNLFEVPQCERRND